MGRPPGADGRRPAYQVGAENFVQNQDFIADQDFETRGLTGRAGQAQQLGACGTGETMDPLGSRAKLDRGRTEAIGPVGPEAREQALAFQRAEQAQRRALGQVEGPREIGEPPFRCLIGERPEDRKRPPYGLGSTQGPA